ncbi:arylesterase [Pararhodonellum marinum]|uniref:arylesterase n=1 Tax=Pararhodonellum marinum TaxID=2755358 RepID=UPI003744B071
MFTKSLSIPLFLGTCLLFFAMLSCQNKPADQREDDNMTATAETEEKGLILFFGNSLTAGYGIDTEDAFPGLIQARIDSMGLPYRVINGGLSGETTASGKNRLDWFLEEEPAVFILELGGNDGLRGIPIEETRNNLLAMIQDVQTKFPDTHILLAGMQIPPNMGSSYTNEFQKIFPEVAQETEVTLIPFLLEGVAGDPALNLPDGIHPTEEGHKIVFETVWSYLKHHL